MFKNKGYHLLVLRFWQFISHKYHIEINWPDHQKIYNLSLSKFTQLYSSASEEQILHDCIVFGSEFNLKITNDTTELRNVKIPQINNIDEFVKIYRNGIRLKKETDGKEILLTFLPEQALASHSNSVTILITQKQYLNIVAKMLKKKIIQLSTQTRSTLLYKASNVVLFVLFHALVLTKYFNITLLFYKVLFLIKYIVSIWGYIFENNNPIDEIRVSLSDFVAKNETLPIYTILIPLYKEKLILPQLINHLSQINYPKELLDIKILTEEDDAETNNALSKLKIPKHFSIVKVPKSEPRTKSKAINYGALLSFGEYITIYDAEDTPDPNQLLISLNQFKNTISKEKCLAVQCPLYWYNGNKGIIPKMMSLEYNILYQNSIPTLSKINSFIPLGGTSNHLHFEKLQKLNLWNSWNVTEDFELALQAYTKNYKIVSAPLGTGEESVTKISHWIAQRARWLSGFIVSIAQNFIKINLLAFKKPKVWIGFYVFGWMNIVHPIFWIIILKEVFIMHMELNLTIILFYWITQFSHLNSHNLQSNFCDRIKSIIQFLFYNLMFFIPLSRAIYESIFRSSKWNKTPHFCGYSSNNCNK